MTRAHLPGSFRNSTNVVLIDTSLHRCTQMEEDVAYPLETRNQGRDASNPVPAFSMYAGKPVDGPKWNKAALLFWSIYWALFGLSVIAAILAVWPN